jgi:hypothetical protein
MHEKNLNVRRGFTPTTVVPSPNAIYSQQVICHYRKVQRWVKGGDRHCPLLSGKRLKLQNFQKI